MDSDPWADAPSTPKLPSLPSSPVSAPARASTADEPQSPTHPAEASSSSPKLTLAPPPPPDDPGEPEKDGFDDFDDFDVPAGAGPSGDDEGFGDFGDFEDGDFDVPVDGIAGVGLVDEPSEQQERWHALNLRPFPPKGELLDQLSILLSPLYSSSNNEEDLTNEQPRIGNGLSQVLVGESSRDAYAQLTTAPMLKPLDWTRSRVRREHLISMGVPVNLDEVDSHRLSALPPLRITTNTHAQDRSIPRRAESLDVNGGRYSTSQKGKSREVSPNAQTAPNSAGVMKGARGIGKYGLGGKPEFDGGKAEEYCGLEEAALQKLQADIAQTSALASFRLAWELQLKDAQTQDAATYNGMISELISNAAKVKSAQVSSGGVFRKSSVKRPQSVSGTVTPRRTGSPGMW
uniref:Uncharacterized protein n=1 Tax=Kwoniella bestiolae CBS 10118 TaxID=1296100 RepID=A0A1B9G7Y9_9TREE|nr:hypothetical protein I302_01971 [Kwoniella bestiolae CBS 10118]OCF27136.1 hypothetical protein I302_01971 [Kwoniella bestiolae CBS 10118]